MDETIGRDTLIELIKLQIKILTAYKDVLDGDERRQAKAAVNKIVKAAIEAAGPVLRLQEVGYDKLVYLHEEAVEQTRDLLQKLLEEEQGRAGLHEELRRSAEGGDRQA